MAELILTEQEKASESYLDWDDESIGRAVKKIALKISDIKGKDTISWSAGVLLLISQAADANADTITLTIEGLTSGGESLGDWRVSAERIDQ